MKNAGSSGFTKQRQAVLRVIQDSEKHLTANEVFANSQQLLPGISFATVYNSLRYLRTEGLIGEVRFGAECTRYDRTLTRHDHALCTSCGKLVDFELPIPRDLMNKATSLSHFQPESVELILRGLCPDCT